MDSKGDRDSQGRISQLLSWAGPRTVVVPRSAQGFGFTLRHFVVYPPESATRSPLPQDGDSDLWQNSSGQGPEPLDTIFVKTVREGSTAHLAGLTAGDRIVAVNGEPVSGKSYAEVIALIHSSHRTLKLLVVPRDEDILQMAYQSQSADSLSGSANSLVDPNLADMQDSNPSPLHKTAVQLAVTAPGSHGVGGQSVFSGQSPRHGTFTTVLGSDIGAREEARMRREEFGRMKSTLVRDDPVARRASQARESFGRPMSQDSGMRYAGGVPSRAKYSFGLYFPPRQSPANQSRATSADNLTHSIPVTAERTLRAGSDTSSSSSLHDSGSVGSGKEVELVGRAGAKTPSPRHSYTHSASSDYGRDGRYYVPVLNQYGRTSDLGTYGSEVRTRSGGERPQRASVGSSVTVTTQPAAERPHRSSLGSSLSRTRESGDGGGHGHTTFVVRIPVSGASTSAPQHSYGSSFAVTRSPRHTTIDVQRQSASRPAHIEVETAPSKPATHIVEVQRQSPGPTEKGSGNNGNGRSVWQRKVLFENGQNENNVPNGSKVNNRHRSEIEKLTNQRKFASVATRLASFEKSSDEDGDETPGRENTPPSQPQPGVQVRRVSVERYPGSQDNDSILSEPFSPVEPKVELAGKEEPAGPVPGATPVRIFVSPSNRNVPSPPVVEIVPVCKDKEMKQPVSVGVQPMSVGVQPMSVGVQPMSVSRQSVQPPTQPVQVVQPILRESSSMPMEPSGYHQGSTERPLSVHEWPRGAEVDWQMHAQEAEYAAGRLGPGESGINSRPQRKSSYLSAVNAPAARYSLSPSPEHDEMDVMEHEGPTTFYLPSHAVSTSVMSASDSAVIFSHPNLPMSSASGAISTSSVNTLSSVILRKKTADTVEDSMAKLHRRTSYLMATARDRSNNTPSGMDTNFAPYSVSIPEEPTYTPVRQYSLNKLKNFFGEQTPCIMEATERSRDREPQPDSPLPDITREGPLWCKTAMSDGKKCSDRSWKQVWAVLRGHALFLIRDRREGNTPPTFSFEEPPISIKSCLVDIAHDYSRKRKHVFRLTTYSESVYLLQAEDKGTMMSWIQAIKTNNNPDHDDEGIGSAELIRRKVSTQAEGGFIQTSPQTAHREKDKDKEKEKEKEKAKKLAGISFKAKFPHSPSVRRKKPEESGKKGGWKGRIMPRSFKKQTADEQALSEEAEDISKCTFCIPLEDCFPSPNNEYVPLIVELCTRIVEVRGLEVVGVYRVPGNSVAVSHMQEELNRGIENMNMDNDKWLDVNVVSSLLKAFFRKLPHPLVTPELYDSFIEANRNPNPEKRMLKLKRLLHTLPEHHYETFKHLAEHLSTVAAHGLSNKMDAKNLAIMFGPTLIRKVEDDTSSLVMDMSDQCRIVESIILHNDWFFSNWTQDHTVPMDSGEHVQPCGTDTRVLRDDDEDADSAINTKEIISSIVSAANKKLKLRQQNKSTDSLDFETSFSQHSSDTATSVTTTTATTTHSQRAVDMVDGRYQERSVDTAVARATVMTKSQASLTSSLSASEECLDRRTTAPLATSEPDFLDWEERMHYAGRGRQMSEDTLLERSDEVVGGWVGRDTLDWLKRLEQEARTIRRLEEQRQRDMERRRRQQQMIERELQRSQRDLEMEDTQSVEDILAWSTSTPSSAAPLMTSTWSRKTPRAHPSAKSEPALQRREQDEGLALAAVNPTAVESRSREQKGGGKYFVSVANTRDSFLLRPTSLENLVEVPTAAQFSRTGSLENMVDGPVRDFQPLGSRWSRGSGGLRHGSLDSLLDMLEQEPHGGGGSSDSEDGSDLLTSLTTTFDQKLQILLNPKYRLSSRHSRLPHSHSRHSRNSGELSRIVTLEGCQGLEGCVTQDRGRVREAGFRDPSLHRAAKSDTKVGIASRFEWGSAGSSPSSATNGAAASATSGRRKPLPDFRSFLSRTPRPDCSSGNVVLTQPRKLSSGNSQGHVPLSGRLGVTRPSEVGHQNKVSQARPDFRPISKSEKMEVNTALARLTHRDGSSKDDGARPSGTGGSEGLLGSDSNRHKPNISGTVLSDSVNASATSPLSSPVPPTEKEEAGQWKGRSKRRHTVGGYADLEHFKALLAVSGQPPDPRPSAWDQLRPTHKDSSSAPPQDRSLQAWMQKERLRGSTPDLLSCGRTDQQFSS